MKFFLLFFMIINTVSAGQLINEFNFSASTDGLYKLKDGRVFEASSLDGHLKNNVGSYGKIKCNSLIETKKSELIFNTKKILYLPFSRLLSKCYTVLISFKSDIDVNFFINCLRDIEDKKNKYTEHSFYKNLVRKKVTYRNNIVPQFELSMIGGSNQGRYGIFKQLMNKFLYGYM